MMSWEYQLAILVQGVRKYLIGNESDHRVGENSEEVSRCTWLSAGRPSAEWGNLTLVPSSNSLRFEGLPKTIQGSIVQHTTDLSSHWILYSVFCMSAILHLIINISWLTVVCTSENLSGQYEAGKRR
jgi:hypothetical protein